MMINIKNTGNIFNNDKKISKKRVLKLSSPNLWMKIKIEEKMKISKFILITRKITGGEIMNKE